MLNEYKRWFKEPSQGQRGGGGAASVIASIGGNDRVIAVSKEMLNEEDLTQGKQGHKLKLFSKRTTLSVTGSDLLTGGILQRTLCERGQGRVFFRKAAPLSPGTGGLLEKTDPGGGWYYKYPILSPVQGCAQCCAPLEPEKGLVRWTPSFAAPGHAHQG